MRPLLYWHRLHRYNGDLCITHLLGRRASSPLRGKIEMGVNRVWARPLVSTHLAPILTFPRELGKGLKVIQRATMQSINNEDNLCMSF